MPSQTITRYIRISMFPETSCILRTMIILQLRTAPRPSTRIELNEKGDLKPHFPNVTVRMRILVSAIGTNYVCGPGPWVDRWSVEGRLSGVARYAVLGKSGMFPAHVSGFDFGQRKSLTELKIT